MKEFAVAYSAEGLIYVIPFQRFECAEREYNKIVLMGRAVAFMEYNKEKEMYEEIFHE